MPRVILQHRCSAQGFELAVFFAQFFFLAICLTIKMSNPDHAAIYFVSDFPLPLSCFRKAELPRKSRNADPTSISYDKFALQIYRPNFISMMISRLCFCRFDARTYDFSTFDFSNNLFSID